MALAILLLQSATDTANNMQTFMYPKVVLQIFCKAPIAGQVKTRLQPELSATQALAVHQRLVQHTLELVSTEAFCPVQLWCTPNIGHPYFVYLARKYALELKLQTNGDLGQRMHVALTTGINDYGSAVLLGCDCPSLTNADIHTALQTLSNNIDLVLAPTEDGGYSLIGLRQVEPELFTHIDWGTDQVLKQTQRKIEQLSIRHVELPLQWDVDTYADYLRYLNTLA